MEHQRAGWPITGTPTSGGDDRLRGCAYEEPSAKRLASRGWYFYGVPQRSANVWSTSPIKSIAYGGSL